MKNKMALFILITISVALISSKSTNDILKSLSLSRELANKSIIVNLSGVDGFKLPYLKIAPEIMTGDKIGSAKEVCEYIKTYCESNEFASDYEKYRQSEKPTEEEIQQFDAEQLREMREAAKTWDELSKDKSISKEQRDQYKAQADDMKQLLARAEDPTPNLTEWKKNFPENPSVLIKKRLEEYLAIAKTVDFSAQLTQPDEYKIKKFVDPAYESKSLQWKAIFRAGKEVNAVATAFAKQWLADGIKSGQPGLKPQANLHPETQKSATSGDSNNSSSKQEQISKKAKGMIKSLKDKVVKIP